MEIGNAAIHAVGYASSDITYHIHRWITQNGQTGGLDTAQFVYNNLLK